MELVAQSASCDTRNKIHLKSSFVSYLSDVFFMSKSSKVYCFKGKTEKCLLYLEKNLPHYILGL